MTRFPIVFAGALACLAFAAIGPAAAPFAHAQAQAACSRPQAPAIPENAAGMGMADLAAAHEARDRYIAEADQYRLCLDQDIERRMDIMFRTNAAIDPVLEERGLEHASISAERAGVYERFVRLCLKWEDSTRARYTRGCATPPG